MKKRWLILAVSIGLIAAGVFPVLSSWRPPLAGKIIVIDPGHGGFDGGAERAASIEKDIALAIAQKLRAHLTGQGALVTMTRETDRDLAQQQTKNLRTRKTEDLHERVSKINSSGADLLISIHLNAIPGEAWSGAQTFYSPHLSQNEQIAAAVQHELVRNLENTTRAPASITHVFVLNEADMPAALVEVGFLSNERERRLLEQEAYQEKTAAAISRGVMRYFSGE